MKVLKDNAVTVLLVVFLAGFTTEAISQNRAAAVQAYNNALDLVKENKFQEALSSCDEAMTHARKAEESGEQGQDIINRCQKKIPEIYYQMGRDRYAAFSKQKTLSNLEAAIDAFEKAGEVSEEYEVQELKSKSSEIIVKLLYTKSIVHFRNQEYKSSIATLDQVIEKAPNYAQAYYQKGLVVKKEDKSSVDRFLELMDKAIEIGNEANNSTVVSKAKESAAKELVYRGSNSTENKNYKAALDLLQRALEYDNDSSEAHYRLAEAYNKRVMPDEAIAHAQKALQFDNGGRAEKARIYYELALAQKVKGNKEEACQAFENAAYGNFKSVAEHEMEYELECQSATN